MFLKKSNAVLSIIASTLALYHCFVQTVWMLFRGRIAPFFEPSPRVLAIIVLTHAVLCIIMPMRCRGKQLYAKLNIPTLIQRFSGVAMLLLLPLHIMGSVTHFKHHILHAIVHPLFFGIILLHITISASRALITLGIGTAKTAEIVQRVFGIICFLMFCASTVGIYLCLFGGIIK